MRSRRDPFSARPRIAADQRPLLLRGYGTGRVSSRREIVPEARGSTFFRYASSVSLCEVLLSGTAIMEGCVRPVKTNAFPAGILNGGSR